MSTSTVEPANQKPRAILEQLYHQLDRGWLSFLGYRYASTSFEEGAIKDLFYIFKLLELSCLDSVYLVLSKLFVPSDESITIPYLLNYAEAHPNEFPESPQRQIVETVNQYRHQLAAIQVVVGKIRERRDRTIAHLDKKHVNNPSALYKHDALNEMEVQQIFKLALEILNTFAGYIGLQQPFALDAHGAGLAEDWFKLVTLISRSGDNT